MDMVPSGSNISISFPELMEFDLDVVQQASPVKQTPQVQKVDSGAKHRMTEMSVTL